MACLTSCKLSRLCASSLHSKTKREKFTVPSRRRLSVSWCECRVCACAGVHRVGCVDAVRVCRVCVCRCFACVCVSGVCIDAMLSACGSSVIDARVGGSFPEESRVADDQLTRLFPSIVASTLCLLSPQSLSLSLVPCPAYHRVSGLCCT